MLPLKVDVSCLGDSVEVAMVVVVVVEVSVELWICTSVWLVEAILTVLVTAAVDEVDVGSSRVVAALVVAVVVEAVVVVVVVVGVLVVVVVVVLVETETKGIEAEEMSGTTTVEDGRMTATVVEEERCEKRLQVSGSPVTGAMS
jgi:hypothetical protein